MSSIIIMKPFPRRCKASNSNSVAWKSNSKVIRSVPREWALLLVETSVARCERFWELRSVMAKGLTVVDCVLTADVAKMEYCQIILTEEIEKAFVYAVKNQYWYKMYMDDLPIWGKP